MKTLKLLDSQIELLSKLPETGMGYQIVILTLKQGVVMHNVTVLNSEFIQIEDNLNLKVNDIEKIELECNNA